MTDGTRTEPIGIRATRRLFAAALLATVSHLALATPAVANDNTGSLEITVTDLDSDEGFLVVALLNSAAQYDSDDQMFRSNAKVPIRDGKASVTFEDLPFGTYAAKTFHDENANGKLDTNFVGFPKEGFGFSNNAMGKFGPPSFDQSKFDFAAKTLHIEIKSN
ncbi:MAG: DUF2141 domain-containing protein [bacterium]|nr:DUF2141 domain-containing protein [bacterium]